MAGYDIGKFNDIIVFYQNQYCTGRNDEILNYSWTCFQRDGITWYINSIKSIIVSKPQPPAGCVWLFDDHCLLGNKIEVCQDVADINAAPYLFGNKISSYIAGPGVQGVFVYDEVNFVKPFTAAKEFYGMYGKAINKNIKSLKIVK